MAAEIGISLLKKSPSAKWDHPRIMEVNTDKSRDETELALLDAEESEVCAENQYSFQLTIVGLEIAF